MFLSYHAYYVQWKGGEKGVLQNNGPILELFRHEYDFWVFYFVWYDSVIHDLLLELGAMKISKYLKNLRVQHGLETCLYANARRAWKSVFYLTTNGTSERPFWEGLGTLKWVTDSVKKWVCWQADLKNLYYIWVFRIHPRHRELILYMCFYKIVYKNPLIPLTLAFERELSEANLLRV